MKSIFYLCFLLILTGCSSTLKKSKDYSLHPIFNTHYVCSEHYAGQFQELGDALGSDCIVQGFSEFDGKKWLRGHKGDGSANEDWYGWNSPVLSPVNGEVVKINFNKIENQPGVLGKGVASFIILKKDDGLFVMLAHVRDIKVKIGDKVIRGKQIASVGNNGKSWHPHIHIGLWRNKKPLQVKFNQEDMRKFFVDRSFE